MAEHNEIGKIGENIVETFLMKHGFSVLERNYHTRQGEIDIVAKKDNVLHFVEVKAVKVRDVTKIEGLSVTPEDNFTKDKWHKLILCIESYLKHRGVPRETRWQIDLACVYVDTETRQGLIRLLENVYKE
jgi:putative endonuclease